MHARINYCIVHNDSLAIPFLNYTGQCWVPNHGSSHNVQTSKEEIKEIHSKVCTVILMYNNKIIIDYSLMQTLVESDPLTGDCNGYNVD